MGEYESVIQSQFGRWRNRAFIRFGMDNIPQFALINSATLYVYYSYGMRNDLNGGRAPDSSRVGHVIIDHIDDWGTHLANGDFGAAAKTSNIGTLVGDDVAPSGWYTLDVTDYVSSDHVDQEDYTSYRLRQSLELSYASYTNANYWGFRSCESDVNPPYIEIEWIQSSSSSSSVSSSSFSSSSASSSFSSSSSSLTSSVSAGAMSDGHIGDGYTSWDGNGDCTRVEWSIVWVGEFDGGMCGEGPGTWRTRGLMRFDISAIPDGSIITSATLNVRYRSSSGDGDPPDSARVGSCILDHIEDFGTLEDSDYQMATKTSDIGTLVPGDTAPISWRQVDVTAYVQQDLNEQDTPDNFCVKIRQSLELSFASYSEANYWGFDSSTEEGDAPYLDIDWESSSSSSSFSSFSSSSFSSSCQSSSFSSSSFSSSSFSSSSFSSSSSSLSSS